jgi:hypothetical protein
MVSGPSVSPLVRIVLLGGESFGWKVSALPHYELEKGKEYELRLAPTGEEAFVIDSGQGAYQALQTSITAKTGGWGYLQTGLHWGSSVPAGASWKLNQAGTPDITDEFARVSNAFSVWQNDPGSGLFFSYAGTTSACRNPDDNTNTVCWYVFTGNEANYQSFSVCAPGFPDINQFRDCDMLFNENDNVIRWTSESTQAVATHEAGHWVGLDDLYPGEGPGDPEDIPEVMYTSNTRIWWGDAMGIRSIYSYYRGAGVTLYEQNQGLGVDTANIDGDSLRDAVFVWARDHSDRNRVQYMVGFDISDSDGSIASWIGIWDVQWFWIGSSTPGVGAALKNINEYPPPDLLVAWVNELSGENALRYRIGWDMTNTGSIPSRCRGCSPWTSEKSVPGVIGSDTFGVGAAVADIGGSSRPDLILGWVDGSGYVKYKIGLDLTTSGDVGSWQATSETPWTTKFGLGLDVSDIDENGVEDFVVTSQSISGDLYIHIGWDISGSGATAGWSRGFLVGRNPAAWPWISGLGLGLHTFGSTPRLGMLTAGLRVEYNPDRIEFQWA